VESRANNFIVAGLVLAGLMLIAGMVAHGFRREAAASSANSPVAAAGARIERRKVPGLSADEIRGAGLSLKEAMYYEKLAGGKVRCTLCPTMCVLDERERGSCRARINIGGILRTLVYGRVLAQNDDPIEKKPLFHYLPGSRSFSIATAGCNLGCVFCQNWQISQALPEEAPYRAVTPEQVVAEAKRLGCRSISYTYTEPTVFYEFMLDCCRLAHREGIRNVWVTCGYINPAPLRELCKVLDAANIDVKGFDEAYYRRYCGGSLEPVLTALRIAREEKVWVEVTNLIVPGGNDDPRMIAGLCKWHMAHLGPDVPLHFSRFFPKYQMADASSTPLNTLLTAAKIAREAGIRYVYIGNVATPSGEDTLCPKCGRALVRRQGFIVLSNAIRNGHCPDCGAEIAGAWTAK
jgi:pyruvate formate lyase activating enzyme